MEASGVPGDAGAENNASPARFALHLMVDLFAAATFANSPRPYQLSEQLNCLTAPARLSFADLNRLQLLSPFGSWLKVLKGGLFGLKFLACACAEASDR